MQSADLDSYVITEDDYIEYLAQPELQSFLPVSVHERLKSSHILFMGYALRDWNLRVVLRRIWDTRKLTWKSWAVQLKPNDPETDGLDPCCHEFGHVLGLVHESNQPNATISWNRPVVYKELATTSGWDRASVDRAVFAREGKWLPPKPFDPKSIMMSAIPRSWTTDGVGYEEPTALSAADKAYIAQLYPRGS